MAHKSNSSVNSEEQLMTVAEVAAFLRISPNTVRALTDRGELRCYRIGGRKERRFSRADVQAYLDRHSQATYSPTEIAHYVKEPPPSLNLSPTAVLNRGLHVHDWYLLPQSFSEPLVVEAIERFNIEIGDTILDPFVGAGTTAVTGVLRGINVLGLEINPFLCFAAQVKLDWTVDLTDFRATLTRVLDKAYPLLKVMSVEKDLFTEHLPPDAEEQGRAILAEVDEPQMPRLYKWMSPVVVHKVLVLRHLIEHDVPQQMRQYFLLALAAILRPASNMKLTPHAFGSRKHKQDAPVYDLFSQKLFKMANDLEYLQSLKYQTGTGEIICCDARAANHVQSDMLPASLAITSPPYLNNLDYTMQTRMELFFLRFVDNMADLRDLRKKMVVCDAKAMYRDIEDSEEVVDVQSIQQIAAALEEAHKGKNWGWDYPFMITQYFGGMFKTLKAVKPLLKRRAPFIIIVGESAHSGIKVPVPDILAELGENYVVKYDGLAGGKGVRVAGDHLQSHN
ncbi:MAG TPA: helix-turn-helix domain-containing protein, partial [Desulfobacterales bacterium]|nr:helix-turn-helix domain-containing protein [Desulfobacterales bacterium]